MDESKFESGLTEEEILENFVDTDVPSGIMAGLEEALAYEKGGAKVETIVKKRGFPDIDGVYEHARR